MSLAPRLGATYRLQLRPGWGFEAAARIVPYLARLGVETVYLSPVAEAVPGSTHGYDGVDPARLRGELGGETGYDALVAACGVHGLGVCVDHVPNHLATWHRGPWWRQLLAEGRDSPMGEVFDVDWDAAVGADGSPQVMLPLLDRPVEEALGAGLVRLAERDGSTVVEVGEGGALDLPVAAGTARAGDGVADVLAAQHYRLVDWHDAAARNYRRFFDIDGLVGVRVEVPAVFDRTHALVVALARSGRLSAIRVDHVDGLRDPTAYLHRLVEATGVPVVVEKILTADEHLRPDWPVEGTTGYEVVDDVGGVLVDADGLQRLVAAGRAEGDHPVEPLTVETRRLVAAASFPAELGRAARALGVGTGPLEDVVVRLPRYRTYLRPRAEGGGDPPEELAVWRDAVDVAGTRPTARRANGVDGAGGAGGAGGVGGAGGAGIAGADGVVAAVVDPARRPGALTLQQVTGAVMAKGVEDTAWYRLAGPLAFCEVGGDPALDRHDAVSRFHRRAAVRAARQALGLVPGTTHDTKRSEDARCRLYALSEAPDVFEAGLVAARAELGLPADGGDLAFESRVAVQLALAILPPSTADGAETIGDAGWPDGASLAERLGAAMEKGGREAKRRSSWQRPDATYEARLREMACSLLNDRAAVLRRAFGPAVDDLARRSAVNSLTAVVLRHASPGIPDTYQGDEAWNLSLVDPDNRRPVDHDRLARALDGLPAPEAVDGWAPDAVDGSTVLDAVEGLRRNWADGRIKLFVTARCLAARRGRAGRSLAAGGRHLPLSTEGAAAGSVLSLARAAPAPDGPWVVAVTTRRAGALHAQDGDLPWGPSFAGTRVALPKGAPVRYRDALTGRAVDVAGDGLALDHVLGTLPVALLVSEGPARDAGTASRA